MKDNIKAFSRDQLPLFSEKCPFYLKKVPLFILKDAYFHYKTSPFRESTHFVVKVSPIWIPLPCETTPLFSQTAENGNGAPKIILKCLR